ncbi:MarR family EPS-associated transcriptional regulator [Acidithiobacillus caldus]|uniref:MarR family EPS-associated transcriptional regulator n=1 Tax=Acidithiobacillus caldus TaxID=33059 RepID=UPI001C06971E|nr:MarR family EPS-associated transcriptional regulator [Acidithiobacillus caldus]MBU2783600.1 MarR family EPS-associated transcriptional regulator [Acidithiobacillus caldus]
MLPDPVSREETELTRIAGFFRHLLRHRVFFATRYPHAHLPLSQHPSTRMLTLNWPEHMTCLPFSAAQRHLPGSRLVLYAEAMGSLWSWESLLLRESEEELRLSLPASLRYAHRREHYRVRLSPTTERGIRVRGQGESDWLTGEIEDLSEGGVRISGLERTFAVEDLLELRFTLAEQGEFELLGEVRHARIIKARAQQLDTPAKEILCSHAYSSCEHKMKLDDATRYRLLKLIAEHPGYTQRELAAAMGVSVGKTNFCVKALISKGLVEAEKSRRNREKGAYAYHLTPKGIEDKAIVTVRFLQRKMAEYDVLMMVPRHFKWVA